MYSTWWRSSCTSFPVESHCTMYYATTLLCPKSKEALVEINVVVARRSGAAGIFPSARRRFIASPASRAASARLQNSITVKMSSAYVELQSGTAARGLHLSRFGEMRSLGHILSLSQEREWGGWRWRWGGGGGALFLFLLLPLFTTTVQKC